MRYIRARYEQTLDGDLVRDAAICLKASEALNKRDSKGRLYDVLVLPLKNRSFAVIAPALGIERAGEFACVAELDAQLRFKEYACG